MTKYFLVPKFWRGLVYLTKSLWKFKVVLYQHNPSFLLLKVLKLIFYKDEAKAPLIDNISIVYQKSESPNPFLKMVSADGT